MTRHRLVASERDTLTLRAAARLCQIRPSTVSADVRAKRIPSRRRGNRILVRRSDAIALWSMA